MNLPIGIVLMILVLLFTWVSPMVVASEMYMPKPQQEETQDVNNKKDTKDSKKKRTTKKKRREQPPPREEAEENVPSEQSEN